MDRASVPHLAWKWKEIPIELLKEQTCELRHFKYDSHRYTEVLLFSFTKVYDYLILHAADSLYESKDKNLEKREMPYLWGHVCLPWCLPTRAEILRGR